MTIASPTSAQLLARGRELRAAQRHLDAADCLSQAVELNLADMQALRLLADTLSTLRRYAGAAEAFAPVARKTKNPAELVQLAQFHDASGNLDAALAIYDRIKLPDRSATADIHVLKAGALLARARRQEARTEIGKALGLHPSNASLRLFIAKNFLAEFGAREQADWIAHRLASPKASRIATIDRARLYFAQGLALERLKDYPAAFTAIERANQLCAPKDFSADAQVEQVATSITAHFTKARLAQLAPAGHPSRKPVFVTGMPRSGTTLVEQIIAAHPLAASVGEFELLAHLKQSFVSLQQRDLTRAGNAWLDAATALAPASERIVDKSISTLMNIGLALVLFPNARIVIVRRHPMDVFWSAYREMFGTGAMTFSYSPHSLVRRIAVAEREAEEWQKREPTRISTVFYERLASEPEPHARALIDHAGLDWNDACLEFHKADTVVRTASMAQVREQVYTSSMNRWRAYETRLAPVAQALKHQIAAYEHNLESSRP
jgi:tetratricopeptide (TPR) repeat protein